MNYGSSTYFIITLLLLPAKRERKKILKYRALMGGIHVNSFQLWVEGKITRDSEGSNAVAPNPVTLEAYLKTHAAARQLLGI